MQFLADNIAVISLIALVIAIVITIWQDTNLGTMALGIAFILGHFIGGYSAKELISGYPTSLFLMLVGITYFFGVAQSNGTLEKVTQYAVKSVKGNVAILPIVLFFLAAVISSIGAGQISTAALFATPVMALAVEVGINPLLMAIVVGCGAMAGVMSPLTANGIIGKGIFQEMGIVQDYTVEVWLQVVIAHFFAAVLAYFLFGGLKLWKKQKGGSESEALKNIHVDPFTNKQKLTLLFIALLIISIIVFKLDVGFVSFILGTILILMKAGDERAVFKVMPWGAIIMVTGVTVLVNLMKDIGGMDLFAEIMANLSTPLTVTLIVGFIAAVVSAYASTSGVILPAFLPMAPLLIEKIGAPPTTLMPLLMAIIVAGHLTDMSPLSTTGAVFVAGAPSSLERKPLYKGMLLWGMGMAVFGAVYSFIFFGLLNLA